MARTLDVYLHEHLAGRLTQDDSGEMTFAYAESWLNDPAAIPLSQSLPLRKERYTRRECRGYFAGVLPEGDNRALIAKNLGISANNDFSMLEQIGGECAGAVTFIPSGQPFPERNDRYRHLTASELANILLTLPRRPLLAGEDNVRLSLAGVQDKLAVHVADGQISIPLGGAPSTHILKPAIDRFAGTVINEALCMRLARAVGLRTATAEMGSTEGIDYLLVERYDRARDGAGDLERLHQEDFCQALGIVSEHKYQNEGGPSVSQCFQLVRNASTIPIIDLQALLDGIIFNFLIGNNDAHGKNFSLLYKGATPSTLETGLAPFYDMLSTVYYPELSGKMAMKIGGEYSSEKVSPRHFERLAEEAGLGKPMVKRRVRGLAESILSNLPEMTTEHPVDIGVAALIRSRCERTIQQYRE